MGDVEIRWLDDGATMNVPMVLRARQAAKSSRAPSRVSSLPAEATPDIPGYELLHVLGRGGEGVVWEAIERKLERRVALKIHSSRTRASQTVTTNLWTEARFAARIGDPSIVTVLDVGLTLDGRRFYTMELVRGTDVADLVARGPLTPHRAMTIASEVARAVAAAHAHGIIHRDLKPRNVIIDIAGRARVLDFGIALDMTSGVDDLAGMLAGSPRYMAPEQIRGGAIGPYTDVWALGVLLYEMLTGQSPFDRSSMLDTLEAITSTTLEPPSALVPGIHRDIDALVKRCLMAAPADRFPSAAALHECLRSVLEGHELVVPRADETFSYTPRCSHERVPGARPQREDADKHLAWSWKLRASARQLWPLVSDTERFNEAVGLAPMAITTEIEPDGRRVQRGAQRTLGLELGWQEFPYEWVAEKEQSVFRWYSTGPIRGIWSRVTLTPLEDGGTELTHEIWVMTRGLLGKLASFVELDQRLARAAERFYRGLDEKLAVGASTEMLPAHAPSTHQRAVVAASMAQLRAGGFDERIVLALEAHLLLAPNSAVSPLRPFELADRWKTSRDETADALIHAASHGALVPLWNIVCPLCRVAHTSVGELRGVTEQSTCSACAFGFVTELDDSVELVFAPEPSVRSVKGETYCFGSPARRPHVSAQKMLDAHDEVTIGLDLAPGTYRVVADHARSTFELLVTATGFAASTALRFDGQRFEGGPVVVRAGEVAVRLRNGSDREEVFRIENVERRRDVFSAVHALTHPAFRALFDEQLPMPGACMPVRELAFVFVRIASCRDLVAKLGDAAACAELSRLSGCVMTETARFQGSVVPSSLSLVTVAFSSSAAAVRAALALRTALDAEEGAGISIAVDHGGCVAIERAGRLEFFGSTLHRGETLVAGCPAGALAISEALMSKRRVALLVHESGRRASLDFDPNGKRDLRATLLRG